MATSTGSPCAACKFLRRKCTAECVFAPYFPAEDPNKFANVHKVFGASNVSKILNELPSPAREDAVNSLAYEADARVKDPVYGCVGAISILQSRVAQLQAELVAARSELCRLTLRYGALMPPNQPHQSSHLQVHPSATSTSAFTVAATPSFSNNAHAPISFAHSGPRSLRSTESASSASQQSFAAPFSLANQAPTTSCATLQDCGTDAAGADQYASGLDDHLPMAISSQNFLPPHQHQDFISSSKSNANVVQFKLEPQS